MRYCVIVAGGRSTRFGEADKAVADLAGTPMIRRVADRVAGVVDALVVNARDEQLPDVREAMRGYGLPVTYAADPDPDEGPVAGIRTGLRTVERLAAEGEGDEGNAGSRGDEGGEGEERDETGADEPYAFVVACDMPFVDPAVVDYLFERAAGREAAVPQLEDEWFQTTHAVYRPEPMADACEEKLAAGERRVVAPLRELDRVVVGEDELRERGSLETFENVNTREEFDRAAERLSEEEGETEP